MPVATPMSRLSRALKTLLPRVPPVAAIRSISVIAILLNIVLFVVSLKLIIRSIAALRMQLDNIAQGEGDLTKGIPITVEDDLGQLARSFNIMCSKICKA